MAAVVPVAGAPFPTKLFPTTQLSMNMLGCSIRECHNLFPKFNFFTILKFSETLFHSMCNECMHIGFIKKAFYVPVPNFILNNFDGVLDWDLVFADTYFFLTLL